MADPPKAIAIVDRYPQQLTLPNREELTFRPLDAMDAENLIEFFQQIPPKDRMFLKNNVQDPAVVEGWCKHIDLERVFPLLALHEGRIMGDATLHHTRTGWMNHIGKVRVVIHPHFRKKRLAAAMVKELIRVAPSFGLRWVEAEFMAEQIGARRAFGRMGFVDIAVLPQYVSDLHTQLHDLVIMGHAISGWDNACPSRRGQ